MTAADELLVHAHGKALIVDTGYDSNRFLQAVRNKGMKPVIHSKPEREKKHRLVRKLYRMRYLAPAVGVGGAAMIPAHVRIFVCTEPVDMRRLRFAGVDSA